MKKTAITTGILLNIGFIMLNYHKSLENTQLRWNTGEESLTMLSFNNMLFMVFGNLFLCLAIYIITELHQYKVGKGLSMYMICMGITFYLAPIASYNLYLGYLCDLLSSISCIFLFHTFGAITFFDHTKRFRGLTAIQICFFLLCFVNFYTMENKSISSISNGMILFTVVITLVMCISFRNSVTEVSKRQIEILFVGILLGGLLYYCVLNLPTLSVVNVKQLPDTYRKGTEIEIIGNYEVSTDKMPILVFAVIALSFLLLMMKREFFEIRRMTYLIKMVVVNLYILFTDCFLMIICNIGEGTLLFFDVISVFFCLYMMGLFGNRLGYNKEEMYNLKVLEEIEEEKQKLAVFLHDDILQGLISILHRISNKKIDPNENNAIIELRGMITQIRSLSHELYPIIVKDIGLEHGLDVFFHEVEQEQSVEILYEYDLPLGVIPETISLTLYRIIKELVTNSVKHAKCNSIHVELKMSDHNVIVASVSDNGTGFIMPTDENLLKNAHMGLYTVKKQIEKVNGEFRCVTEKDKGTKCLLLISI